LVLDFLLVDFLLAVLVAFFGVRFFDAMPTI
jgi:hypothetical protein